MKKYELATQILYEERMNLMILPFDAQSSSEHNEVA